VPIDGVTRHADARAALDAIGAETPLRMTREQDNPLAMEVQ
jgi:hypothetical protein